MSLFHQNLNLIKNNCAIVQFPNFCAAKNDLNEIALELSEKSKNLILKTLAWKKFRIFLNLEIRFQMEF